MAVEGEVMRPLNKINMEGTALSTRQHTWLCARYLGLELRIQAGSILNYLFQFYFKFTPICFYRPVPEWGRRPHVADPDHSPASGPSSIYQWAARGRSMATQQASVRQRGDHQRDGAAWVDCVPALPSSKSGRENCKQNFIIINYQNQL